MAVALEGEDVGAEAIEEEAIVADHHRTTRERLERLLERAQRLDVEVVGRLVEQQDIAALLQHLGHVDAVALAARQLTDLLLLVGAAEVEGADIGTRPHLLLAEAEDLELVGDFLPDVLVGIEVGSTVKLGYVDQSRDDLDPNKNVWEEVSDGLDVFRFGKQELGTRAYVGAFNFRGPDQQKKVGQLSGGERNRVHMAKMLKEGGNVLLLDEPTNDLDVETLRALEEALETFAGCAVVISHDRFFLDRLATHILAFEGDSHVEWFEGNYESYEEDKRRRLGDAADRPTRLAYKKLTR